MGDPLASYVVLLHILILYSLKRHTRDTKNTWLLIRIRMDLYFFEKMRSGSVLVWKTWIRICIRVQNSGAVEAQNGVMKGRGGSHCRRGGLIWSHGGLLTQICITLIRSRIRIRIKVKIRIRIRNKVKTDIRFHIKVMRDHTTSVFLKQITKISHGGWMTRLVFFSWKLKVLIAWISFRFLNLGLQMRMAREAVG